MRLVHLFRDVYLVGSKDYELSASMDPNCYLIDGGNRELALIDLGGGLATDRILENIQYHGFNPKDLKYLIATHCHYDHANGAKELREFTGGKVCIHENEAEAIERADPELTLEQSLMPWISTTMGHAKGYKVSPCKVDWRLKDGDVIKVGKYELKVIHVPGHSPGGICLLAKMDDGKNVLFSGDCVFTDGRLPFMNMPGCDIELYKNSIERLVKLTKPLPIHVLLPGHRSFKLANGQKYINMVYEKLQLPFAVILSPHSSVAVFERFPPDFLAKL